MANPFLDKLRKYVESHPKTAFFGKPATTESIAQLESVIGRALPQAHREFLLTFDGGFISIVGSKGDEDWDVPTARWNSNCFLKVKDIAKEYRQLKKIASTVFEWKDPWHFVPVMQTSGQELLAFAPANRKGESQIVDAFHEVGPEDWSPVFKSFDSLLKAYLSGEGEIETIASS